MSPAPGGSAAFPFQGPWQLDFDVTHLGILFFSHVEGCTEPALRPDLSAAGTGAGV